jgi:hypothetical protein
MPKSLALGLHFPRGMPGSVDAEVPKRKARLAERKREVQASKIELD